VQNVFAAEIMFWLSIPITAISAYLVLKGRHADLELNRRSIVNAVLIFAITFEALALVRWLTFPILPTDMFGDVSWRLSELETKIHYLIGIASPILLVLLALSFLPRYVIGQIMIKGNAISKVFQLLARMEPVRLPVSPRVLLACALAASVLLPIYPYLPGINPDFRPVSVDIFYYKPWLDTVLASEGTDEFLRNVFINTSGGDRPLSLLFFVVIHVLTGLSAIDTLKVMPIFLTPMMTLAVYYFVKTGSNNRHLASIISIIAPVSTTVIVGIYAGFYANWIALSAIFLGLAFMLKYLATNRPIYVGALLGCTILVLFAHNYTWSYFISALVLFGAIYAILNRRNNKALRVLIPLAFIVAISIGADLAKMAFLQNDSGLGKEFTASTSQLSGDEFTARWRNLWYVFTIFLGGFYTNSVIYVLALAWTLGANYRNNMSLALLSLTFIGVIALVAGEYSVQARVIWNMPIFVSAGIAMYSLLAYNTHISRLAFVALLLYFGNYAFRSLANLQFP
jgi:hypothetical protein